MIALWLAACTSDSLDTSGQDPVDSGADDTSSAGGGCAVTVSNEGERFQGAALRGEHDGTSWATYSSGAHGGTTAVLTGDFAHALIAEVGATIDYTLFLEKDGAIETCDGSTTGGAFDASAFPAPEVLTDTDARSDDRWLVGSMAELMGDSFQFAVDREGNLLFARMGDPDFVEDLAYLEDTGVVQCLRVAHDGDEGRSNIISFTWAEDLDGRLTTEGGHHDYDRLADGAIAVLTAEAQVVDGDDVVSDGIWEYDEEGVGHQVYSSFSNFEPVASTPWYEDFFNLGYDWSHGNDVQFYPERDSYVLSLARQGTIVEVARSTGEVIRVLGTLGYPVVSGLDLSLQHNPTLLSDDTLLTFNHTSAGAFITGAIEYSIDEENQTLVQTWAYTVDDLDYFLGQAQRLDNGNTLITWGYSGVIREVTPAGDVVWEMVAPEGWFFGRMKLVDELYPAEAP